MMKDSRIPSSKQNQFFLGMLVGAVLLLSAGPVLAQQQQQAQRRSASADALLEEIVITARRREEHLLDQPMSVAAITGEQMQVQGIQSVDDASQYVPNVTLVTAERANNTRVVIRGIGGGFPDPVFVFGSGMYIDGHYIPTSLGGYMSTLDIERIELLRGPQGTLFGKNVVGGLVNIVSKKPEPEFDSSLRLRAGEDGEMAVRGMLNVPFSDTVLGRFSVAREEFDGYYYNRNLGIDSGSKENTSARAALRFLPNDNWTIDASLSVSRKRDDNAGGQCLGDPNGDAPLWGGGAGNLERRLYEGAHADYVALCAEDVAAGDFVNSSDKYTFSDVDEELFQFGANWNASDAVGPFEKASVQIRASYRNMEYTYFADRDYTSWPVDSVGTKGPKGQNNETYGLEFIFEGNTGDNMEWTFGANYFDETAFNGENLCYPLFVGSGAPSNPDITVNCPVVGLHFELVPDNYTQTGQWPYGPRRNPGGPGPFQSEVSVWNKSTAVFGHLKYDINEDWLLDLGLRWTEDDREFHNIEFASTGCDISIDPNNHCDYTAPVNLPHVADSGFFNTAAEKWTEVTPMVSLTRRLAANDTMDDGMVYFLYSEGFLTGGFNTELNSNLPGTAPLLTYDPEQVKNYEVGFKGQFNDGSVQLLADIFYMDYTDQQRSLQLANPDGQYGSEDPVEVTQNVASSKIYGLEFELRASPWEGGFLSVDLGWLENEYDNYIFDDPEVAGGKIDLSNLLLGDFTPDITLNVAVEHEFELASGATLTPRVSMYWQTGFEWATTGSWTKEAPHSSCYQDSYAKFDGRLTYQPANADWNIALYGGNLTDERIIDYCFSTRSVWNWRLQRPRFFGLEFTSHFGRN